ncbi:HTH domain-containing protein [Oculatella sp. LEGE 06141]|uniref:HTH domain-containing protein n=1 Tax=Oculatella sp. LEGE 06141 TaxID=1828648 RepID=UPI001882A1DA|nr:HTH domain-containing protein [Oculatella sp. LEGE 06141]
MESLTKRQQQVLQLVQANPGIIASTVQKELQITKSLIYRYLAQLQGRSLIYSRPHPHLKKVRVWFPHPSK